MVVVVVTVKKCTTKLDARAEFLFHSFNIKPFIFLPFVLYHGCLSSLVTK